MEINNIFNLSENHILAGEEIFEDIFSAKDLRIERIISTGQTTPPGEWYDQESDEWVILLQGFAQLEFENGNKAALQSGDYIFLPAHLKHRVISTSKKPACIWLAIHRKSGCK